MPLIRYENLNTEQPHPQTKNLDTSPTLKILQLMNQEDQKACFSVRRQLKNIAQAAHWTADTLRQKKRIFLVGAGTSGRLGVIEAAECPPTFHTNPKEIQAIMAGGKKAVFRAQEGTEDNAQRAGLIIKKRVHPGDLVVGIAASGVTPFVRSALKTAHLLKARTVLLTCNKFSPSQLRALHIDLAIMLETGPEILSGSTRLKAATATKMALNMMTTAAMVRLGKTYGNNMVDLRMNSRKLKERAIRLVQNNTKVTRTQAWRALTNAKGHVKTAVLMLRHQISLSQAKLKLKRHHGFLRKALEDQ